MPKTVSLIGLEDFPLVKDGDDVASIIVDVAERNMVSINDGDLIVVCQKIVSKAEGRVVKLDEVSPSSKAKELADVSGKDAGFAEILLRESKVIRKVMEQIFIVETKHDVVCLNCGIDKSNVPGVNCYSILPEDPDNSASKIRLRIHELTERKVGVIISDTSSRPFRRGQVNFAIGLSDINAFKDYRGKKDLFGNTLKVTMVAVADELASAAELVMGQGSEGIPVVIVRGLKDASGGRPHSAKDLVIPHDIDLFKNVL